MALRRALGPFSAFALVAGGIIGAGIFINPSLVAQRLPTPGLVLGAWVAGGVVAMAGALAFAELAALYPRAGGEYVYLREAWGGPTAFLFGWASLLMIQGGGIAAVAITFAEYGLRLSGAAGRDPRGVAISAIVALALVNAAGVKPGSGLLNVLVVLKFAALGAIIAGGLFFAPDSPGPAAAAGATPSLPGAGMLAFGAALVPILFSYGGWQNASCVAEEIRDARRALPRAIVTGTAAVVVVYVLINVVYLGVLGHAGLAATLTPAADVARLIFGPAGDVGIAAAIAVSTFGFLDLTLLAPTRITYAMARDGVLPAGLARVHPRFGTPHRAILLQAGWSVLLVSTGTYGGLVDSVVFADWIFFALSVAAVILLRRRIPPASREAGAFLSPAYPAVPILFLAASALVLAGVVGASPVRSALGAVLIAAGIPVYLWSRARTPRPGGGAE